MVRLLHTADVHLGAKFTTLGEKGKEQREQVRSTFRKLVSLAREEKVDILLIAGDLFDSNLVAPRDIQLVKEQFDLLAKDNIHVCIIPGTHDCFDQNSIYLKVDFIKECPNVTLFTEAGWTTKEFPHLNLTIYGRPNLSNRSYESPLQGLKRQTTSRFHIAMAHGSLDIASPKPAPDDHVFTLTQIKESGMDYIALGHWHRPYACSEKEPVTWYSGPPELLSLDQKEPGQILLVTLTDSGKVEVERRTVGIRRCDDISIDATSKTSTQLRNEIAAGADANLVRRVALTGLRETDLDIDDLLQELSNKFFYLKIDDDSYTRVEEYHGEHLIISKFVELMKEYINNSTEEEDRKIADHALQLGIRLFKGEDI